MVRLVNSVCVVVDLSELPSKAGYREILVYLSTPCVFPGTVPDYIIYTKKL